MSYLHRFLEIGGFLAEGTDETDETPRNGVSSVSSVPSGTDTEKSAPSADPTGPPVSEPSGPDGPGPPPAGRGWRAVVARGPVEWRERWGRRANELQDRGEPWDAAEWIAFNETAPDLADAERRGEVVCSDPPVGLSDPEAVAAIDRAFGALAPARWSDRGPRDVRHGPGGP